MLYVLFKTSERKRLKKKRAFLLEPQWIAPVSPMRHNPIVSHWFQKIYIELSNY